MVLFSFFLVSLFLFIFYALGVAHVVFGGDSGDIILAYFFVGVPHPPGYPANTLLGVILTRLVPFGAFAFKANLVSAFYMSGAIGLFSFLLFRLSKNYILSLVGALSLAFNPLFWLYAHIAEVFQLSILLVLSTLIFLFEYWSQPSTKRNNKLLYLSVFFAGLAVFHHQTVLLLAPAYFYALFNLKVIRLGNIREIVKLGSIFFLGVIPYVYVFWAAARNTPINWDNPSNLSGFWRLITRADYGTFVAAPDLLGFSAASRAVHILWYLKVIRADFTYFGIVLIILGMIWIFIRRRSLFWFLTLSGIFTGPFFLLYASFPPVNPLLLGISERFLLINYLFLTIFLFFGIYAIFSVLAGFSKKLYPAKSSFLGLLLSSVFLIFPFYFALVNWVKADLSDSELGEVIGHDILSSADPPGIIFLQGDTATFNTQYSYYIEGINNDSSILMMGRLRYASYRDQIKKYYPNLSFPENFSLSNNLPYRETVFPLIEANFERVPIYSVSLMTVPNDYIWVQQGALKRLLRRNNLPDDAQISEQVVEKIERFKFSKELIQDRYLNFFEEDIKVMYSGIFADNAFELLRHSSGDVSEQYFKSALALSSDNQRARFGLGIFYFEKKDCVRSNELFSEIVAIDSSYWQAWEGLGQVWKNCLGNDSKAEAYFERSYKERNKSFSQPLEEF